MQFKLSANEIETNFQASDNRYSTVYSDLYPPELNDSLLSSLHNTRTLVNKDLVEAIYIDINGDVGYNVSNIDRGLLGMGRIFLLYHPNSRGDISNFVTNGAHKNLKQKIVLDSVWTYYSVGQPPD